MDALPDELLLLILGFVDDGTTLVDAVPLVCKRWHRVSKDPRVWASAVVKIPCCRSCDADRDADGENFEDGDDVEDLEEAEASRAASHRAIEAAARALLHAPALRRLEVSGWFRYDRPAGRPFACELESRVIVGALRRCGAEVRGLALQERARDRHARTRPPHGARLDLLEELLTRFRSSLRYLELGDCDWISSRRVQRALEGLTRLKCLRMLEGVAALAWPSYHIDGRGGLKLGLECLESPNHPDAAQVAAQSLVTGSAATLRRLAFVGGDRQRPLAPRVLAEVRRCEKLRELTCDLADLAVLPALPELRVLRVLRQYYYHGFELDKKALAATSRALEQAGPLASLRLLDVELRFRPGSCDLVWMQAGLNSCEEALKALEALAAAAADVTTLVLTVEVLMDRLIHVFLQRMPRLRTVRLTHCRAAPECLALLTQLPELEVLYLS